MPKDRDQQTPEEPEDAARLAGTRGPGTGSSGEDELPGERSAPGGASGSGLPAAEESVPDEEKARYER